MPGIFATAAVTALLAVATSSSGVAPAVAMDSQLCTADDANCGLAAATADSMTDLYDLTMREAGEYNAVFQHVSETDGYVDCRWFPFRFLRSAFEELLGMSNPAQIKAALHMLEATDACRARSEIRPDDVLVSEFSTVRAPYSDWRAVPMATHVFRLYQSRQPTLPADRQLLLELLDRGVSAGATTHSFQKQQLAELGDHPNLDRTKVLKTVLANSKLDMDLAERLLAHGVDVTPSENDEGPGHLFTPLLAAVADCNGKVDRPLLQLLYKINYNITSGVPVDQAVANQNAEIEFHGNWGFFNSMRLGNLSAFREALGRMDAHAEAGGDVLPSHKKELTGRIDEEITLQLLDALAARPDFDLADVTLADDKQNNFLHYVALDGFDRVVGWTARQLALMTPVYRKGHAARDVYEAITTKNSFKRTPLHNAAALYGTSSKTYRALARLESFVAQLVEDVLAVPTGPPKPAAPTALMRRATQSEDAFGRTPESYDTPMMIKERLAVAGGGGKRSYMALLDAAADPGSGTTLTYMPFTPVPAQGDDYVYPYTYEDSGGWGVASKEVREELDDLRGRCDAIVHQGMPTANELQAYVAQNFPVVFKGAAKDWRFRELWKKPAFVEKYGDAILPIGNTIYPTFLYQKEDTVRMRDWIEAWGHANFVPDAMPSAFSTTFMGQQPRLKNEGTLEAGQLLTKHHHPFFSHFFAGTSGTGSPHHWHMAAMNTVAFGRKRWFLFPPKDAEYSIKPVSRMLKEDVARHRADPNTTMVECVQEAGDILIVPTFWGHATVNVEPVIGVAYEMDSGFCHS